MNWQEQHIKLSLLLWLQLTWHAGWLPGVVTNGSYCHHACAALHNHFQQCFVRLHVAVPTVPSRQPVLSLGLSLAGQLISCTLLLG